MLEQVKIITSRRAYEFGADSIRLSTLSIQPIQQQIQQLFGFQSSTIGTPMTTFGTVPLTFPPGIVFNLGVWIHQEQHIIPIRFIHVEQNRIVIDVAGPTVAIDGIADRLFHFLSSLQAADGSPVTGEPERISEYSEITAQFSYALDTLFAKPFQRLLGKTLKVGNDNESKTIIPTIAIQAVPSDEVLPSVPSANDSYAFTFALRSGTQPDQHIYYSGAPLDSETHLNYLQELEAAFTKSR
jgi:hypothetical protein